MKVILNHAEHDLEISYDLKKDGSAPLDLVFTKEGEEPIKVGLYSHEAEQLAKVILLVTE